jgi:hypothetical protein
VNPAEPKIEVIAHGPYEVTGNVRIRPRRIVASDRGEPLTWKPEDPLARPVTY